MNFVYPHLFWILSVPFVVFAILVSTDKDKLERLFSDEVLRRLRAGDESMPQRLRNIILFAAVFLMIVAMARPVVDKGVKTVEAKGLTLLTALDISGSMRSRDVYPDRLEFAKKKMMQFFDATGSDEVGVAAFAYNAFMLAPFTSDKETLKLLLKGVDESYISFGSTDFSALGRLAAELLKEKKPKILTVFTDGGDEKAIAGFADIVKEEGIDLYVVLVGTKKGAPVLTEEGKPYKKSDGTIAITQRNDALGELAKSLGGAYVVAGNGEKDMKALAAAIHAKYKMHSQGKVTVADRTEYFYYPLALGLLFLLVGLSSFPRTQNRVSHLRTRGEKA